MLVPSALTAHTVPAAAWVLSRQLLAPGTIPDPEAALGCSQGLRGAQVEAMVQAKMSTPEFIILCLEDSNDWSNATSRRMVMQVLPLAAPAGSACTALQAPAPYQACVGSPRAHTGIGAADPAFMGTPGPPVQQQGCLPRQPCLSQAVAQRTSRRPPRCCSCPPPRRWTPGRHARWSSAPSWTCSCHRARPQVLHPPCTAQVDPHLARTVVVSTKLDTRLPQFAGADDVELFLRPPGRLLEPGMLGGAPFFTCAPRSACWELQVRCPQQH